MTPKELWRRSFVHLAYFDDTGSGSSSEIAIVGALLIPDNKFTHVEAIAGLVIEKLIPEDRIEKFEEFHAADLFRGHGVF